MSSSIPLKQRIHVVVSPFHELLCSLHVLYQPDHHLRRLTWSRSIEPTLQPETAEGIRAVGRVSDGWGELLNLPPALYRSMSVEEGIRYISRLPEAEFAMLLYGNAFSLGQLVLWLNGEEQDSANTAFQHLGGNRLHQIPQLRELVTNTLESCYIHYFQREWEYIKPWIEQAANSFREEALLTPEAALNTLHPRLTVTGGRIVLQKAVTYTYEEALLDGIYVYPSAFIHPHLLMDCKDKELKLPLAVNVPGLEHDEKPPADLILSLKAMADPTRQRLLKLLWKEAHCTKQLAPALGISEAAVSKHLTLLANAGLIFTVRKGNYIFYHVNKPHFEMITVLQGQYLEG